jgi:hypothetical protein
MSGRAKVKTKLLKKGTASSSVRLSVLYSLASSNSEPTIETGNPFYILDRNRWMEDRFIT